MTPLAHVELCDTAPSPPSDTHTMSTKNASAKSTTAASSKLAAKANETATTSTHTPETKAQALAAAKATLAKANLAYCDAVATAAVTYAVVLRSVATSLADSGFTKAEVRKIISEGSKASPATIKRAVAAAMGRERSIRKDAHLVRSAATTGIAALKAMIGGGKKAPAKGEGDEGEGDEDDNSGEAGECRVHTVESLSSFLATQPADIVKGAIVRWSAMQPAK